MNERGIEVKVGILVTVCLALLIAFIVLLGDFSVTEGGELFVDVPTSANLKVGAPVKVAGVPAGKVLSVDYHGGEIDEKVGRPVFVRVRIRVDDEMLGTIHHDADFYITTQGVLGEKYVEIDPGTMASPVMKPGDIAEGVPPLRLELMAMNANELLGSLKRIIKTNESQLTEIVTNANEAVRSVRTTMAKVDGMIGRNERKVDTAFDELIGMEGDARQLLASANNAIGDGEALKALVQDARGVAADIRAVSQRVRGSLGPIVEQVKSTLAHYAQLAITGQTVVTEVGGQVKGTLVKVDGVVDKVDGVVVDVAVVAANVKDGKGTIGAFLSDKEMFDDVREMMKDLKRHPWKFLWKE